MRGKLYSVAIAALALTLSASAVNRNVEIKRPASVTSNDVVMYKDATEALLPASVDAEHIISVGKHTNKGRLRAENEIPADFQMAIDTINNEAWIVKCTSKDASVTIPDAIDYNGVTYPVAVIYTQAFSALSTMKEINFGKNVRKIETQAFLVCMSLTDVNLNEGLIEIGPQAFSTFTNKITSLELPSTVEVLGERAFAGTSLAGEFIINKNLREIGGGAFAGKKITGFYINEDGNDNFTSEDGVLYTKDGESLVVYPPALVEPTLTLPQGVKKLAPYAFAYCSTVTKVNLPESLTEIGDFAFSGCKLTEFNVGKNIVKFGQGVLRDNTGLAKITLEEGNTALELTNDMLIDKTSKYLLAVPYNKTSLDIPEGVEYIGKYLCYNNKNVTSVSGPSTLETIGQYAFYGCEAIASVDLKSVEKIENNVFSGVKKASKIVFPSNLKRLEREVFSNAEVAEVVLPDGVEYIGSNAFIQSKIEKVNIPGTVKEFGPSIFYNCASLSELTLGEGLTEIPSTMCYGCVKLYFVDFPSTLKVIRQDAFSMSWLQIADLPEGVTTIERTAFQLAPLHYIDIPNSVETIGDFAFSITNAEYIKCGTGLKSIGVNTFQSNKKAEYITLNEGLEKIGYRALYGEEKISEITIPSTVKEIGDSALIITPLKRLVNLSKVPQPLTTMITGNPYNPYPNVTPIYDTCTLVVPHGSAEAYRSANIWGLYTNIEELAEEGVEAVEDEEEATIVKIYGIDGVERETLGSGLNICVLSNGKVIKKMK